MSTVKCPPNRTPPLLSAALDEATVQADFRYKLLAQFMTRHQRAFAAR